jgi:hypothetical protein
LTRFKGHATFFRNQDQHATPEAQKEDRDMELVLPLEKMTTDDKLRTMEDIWTDLCHIPQAIPSPAWHADVLHAREQRIRQGVSRFGDWSEAKSRIREKLA